MLLAVDKLTEVPTETQPVTFEELEQFPQWRQIVLREIREVITDCQITLVSKNPVLVWVWFRSDDDSMTQSEFLELLDTEFDGFSVVGDDNAIKLFLVAPNEVEKDGFYDFVPNRVYYKTVGEPPSAHLCEIYTHGLMKHDVLGPSGHTSEIVAYDQNIRDGRVVAMPDRKVVFAPQDIVIRPDPPKEFSVAVYGSDQEYRTVLLNFNRAYIKDGVTPAGKVPTRQQVYIPDRNLIMRVMHANREIKLPPVDAEIHCCGPKWRRVWETVGNKKIHENHLLIHFDTDPDPQLIADIKVGTERTFIPFSAQTPPSEIRSLAQTILDFKSD